MKDRGLLLRIIGVGLLLVGVGFALLGPLEIYSFYLFTPGGRLHYEGFGVGSFMFANIAAQIAGYYAIGIAGIILGYGHLTLRRWCRALTVTLLWVWVLAGLPLTIAALWVFADTKNPSPTTLLILVPLAAILYPVAPALLIRFYNAPSTTAVFERRDPAPSTLDAIPLPVRVLCLLFGGYIVALHVVILLRGVFPLFGVLLSDVPGIVAIDVLMLVLALLIWGLARLDRWAWWVSLAVFGLVTLSTLVTLPHYTLRAIMVTMRLPDAEMDLLRNAPFLELQLTIPVVIPLLITLGVILVARRHFRRERRGATGSVRSST